MKRRYWNGSGLDREIKEYKTWTSSRWSGRFNRNDIRCRMSDLQVDQARSKQGRLRRLRFTRNLHWTGGSREFEGSLEWYDPDLQGMLVLCWSPSRMLQAFCTLHRSMVLVQRDNAQLGENQASKPAEDERTGPVVDKIRTRTERMKARGRYNDPQSVRG